MVGLKFWGTSKNSQRTNLKGGANEKSNDQVKDNNGKLKDMDPHPDNESEQQAVTSARAQMNTETAAEQQAVASVNPVASENQMGTSTGATGSSMEEPKTSTQDQKLDVSDDTKQEIKDDEETLHDHQTESTNAEGELSNQEPVLSVEDEQFLQHITEEVDIPPPLPPRRATMIADDGELTEEEIAQEASKISLPATPKEEKSELSSQESEQKPQTWKDRWSQWAVVPMPTTGVSFATPNLLRGYNYMRKKSPADTNKKAQDETDVKDKDRGLAAADLKSAATEVKAESEKPEPTLQQATDKNSQDISSILSSLNLSSINNRVVGISADTQKLLESFNTVLKDIINGGPRAYEDLEKLLSEREPQLDKLFGTLPPFLQSLVKSIPIKMYAALAPQLAAAMSLERSGATGVTSASTTDAVETSDGEDLQTATVKGKPKKKKSKSLIPSLRSLIGEQGAVAAMLKSILNFLEMRFPALAFLTGTNVLMSLSVFILLFVFWYCHKRGKETRLRRLAVAEAEAATGEKAIAIYPSLADLESGAVFEKEMERGFPTDAGADADDASNGKKVREEAVKVPLPPQGKAEQNEKETMEGVGKIQEEMSESDGKVAALIREAEGGV